MTPHPFLSIKASFHKYIKRSFGQGIKLQKGVGGVTLIELTVSAAIISLFIVLTMTFLVNKYTENAIANARSDLLLQTQLTLDLLNRDLKHAANVDSQNRWPDNQAPGSPSNNLSWQSDGDTLVLAVPTVDNSDSVLYEDPNTYVSYKDNYVYYLDGNTLYRRIIAADVGANSKKTTCLTPQPACPPDAKLAENIENLSFGYFDTNDQAVNGTDARSVGVTLKVSRRMYGRQIQVEETIRTVMRNE